MHIGEIFLEFVNMLPAFQTYCLQQSTAVNMLNTLEKEKELLRYELQRQDFVFPPRRPVRRIEKFLWELSRVPAAAVLCNS